MFSVRGAKSASWGLLLLLSSVVFFGGYTIRDARLLNHGQPTPAVVVEHLSQSQGWNVFDSGRLVVRYTVDGATFTRTIWLDDTADARPVGAAITVIVDPKHPARVRTRADANDPVPWAPPFLVAGLAGLVMLVIGGTFFVGDIRERRWQRRVAATTTGGSVAGSQWFTADGNASPPPLDRIVLRYYRAVARVPYLEVGGDAVTFRVPSVFGGKRRWIVPIWEIAVADDSLSATGAGSLPTPVFVDPLVVPYLATTSHNQAANLRLVFRHPQRMPPVRLLGAINTGLPYRRSRSAAGLMADGVALRAQDPHKAVSILAGAGAEHVGAALPWLATYRQTTTDPMAVHDAAVIAKRNRLTAILILCGFLFLVVARVGLDHSRGWWPYLAGGVGVLLGFGTPIWQRRRNAVTRRRIAAEARR